MEISYDQKIRNIISKMPCRNKQLELVANLLSLNGGLSYPNVFLFGHNATGKSFLIQTLIEEFKLRHALLNCIEVYHPSILYESILNQISATKGYRCDDTPTFLSLLEGILKTSSETIYIVLDNAEQLRKLDSSFLYVLLRLRELCHNDNLCITLITELAWEKFLPCGPTPFLVHFPAYSRDELETILIHLRPKDCPLDLYTNYIKVVLGVFLSATRNLRELQHMASLHFNKYLEPIQNDEADPDEVKILWRNIEPILKKAIQTVYLREVTNEQWDQMQKTNELDSKQSQVRATVELPYFTKYLLLASYVASYNPPKTDRKFFLKSRFKKRKVIKRVEEPNFHHLGPKSFPQDRMLAIFYTLIEDSVRPTALISSQISTLVNLRLLSKISQDDQLSSPKYKCLVDLDFILEIAKSCKFDIVSHLNDYN